MRGCTRCQFLRATPLAVTRAAPSCPAVGCTSPLPCVENARVARFAFPFAFAFPALARFVAFPYARVAPRYGCPPVYWLTFTCVYCPCRFGVLCGYSPRCCARWLVGWLATPWLVAAVDWFACCQQRARLAPRWPSRLRACYVTLFPVAVGRTARAAVNALRAFHCLTPRLTRTRALPALRAPLPRTFLTLAFAARLRGFVG